MLELGNIILDKPFFQASLSGYSDYAMRKLAREFGCPLTFAPVMLAKSAAHPKVLAKPAFRPHDDEHPIGAQIMGNDPTTMAKAAADLVNAGYDLIDLNFACPAPKVLRRRRGGALLKEPETIIQIYRRVRESVNCPILMKLRIGFDNSSESRQNFWQIVERSIAEGIDALIIHGRTVKQKYRGQANWDILSEVKHRFPDTTIVASGDIFDARETAKLLSETGLDGALVARGAIGNPWIFRELQAAFEGNPTPTPPTLDEQADIILKHLALILQLYKPSRSVKYFRKFIVNYCRHHPKRKETLKALITAADEAELKTKIKNHYTTCQSS